MISYALTPEPPIIRLFLVNDTAACSNFIYALEREERGHRSVLVTFRSLKVTL